MREEGQKSQKSASTLAWLWSVGQKSASTLVERGSVGQKSASAFAERGEREPLSKQPQEHALATACQTISTFVCGWAIRNCDLPDRDPQSSIL